MAALIAPDGTELTLPTEDAVVGRKSNDGSPAPDLDLGGFERGQTVSRSHARIYRRGSEWYIRTDAAVTTRTKVSGKAVKPGDESLLRDGNKIEFGQVPLNFRSAFEPNQPRRARAA